MLRIVTSVALLSSALLVSGSRERSGPPAPETMFRGGPAHQGVYQGGGSTLLGLAWRAPTDGDVVSSAAIANGVVYVGSGDGFLYALDLATVPDAVRDPLSYARATFLHNSQGARRTAEAAADLLGPELVEGLIRAGLAASYGVVPPTPVVTLTTDETTAAKRLLIVDASVSRIT